MRVFFGQTFSRLCAARTSWPSTSFMCGEPQRQVTHMYTLRLVAYMNYRSWWHDFPDGCPVLACRPCDVTDGSACDLRIMYPSLVPLREPNTAAYMYIDPRRRNSVKGSYSRARCRNKGRSRQVLERDACRYILTEPCLKMGVLPPRGGWPIYTCSKKKPCGEGRGGGRGGGQDSISDLKPWSLFT